jgi:hypothetical protein
MGNGRIDGWQCIIGRAIIHRSQNYLVDVRILIVFASYSMAMERDHRPGADSEMLVYQAGILRILSIVTRWPTGFIPALHCGCGNHSWIPILRVKGPKSKVFLRVTSSKKAVLYESPPE